MGRWDSREASDDQVGRTPIKLLILLIIVMGVLWFVIIGLTLITPPPDCTEINNILHSSEYFELSEQEQKFYTKMCEKSVLIK